MITSSRPERCRECAQENILHLLTRDRADITVFHPLNMLVPDKDAAMFLNIMFIAPMGRFQLQSKLELPLISGFTSFMLLWRFHQLLFGFLAKGHFPWVSANYKDDNEMKPGVIHGSPGIYLTAEAGENSARRQSDESCVTSHHLKWGYLAYLLMTPVGSHIL